MKIQNLDDFRGLFEKINSNCYCCAEKPKMSELQEAFDSLSSLPPRITKADWEYCASCDCLDCPLNKQDKECGSCPACGSERTYITEIRVKDETWKCRDCEHEFITTGARCADDGRPKKGTNGLINTIRDERPIFIKILDFMALKILEFIDWLENKLK